MVCRAFEIKPWSIESLSYLESFHMSKLIVLVVLLFTESTLGLRLRPFRLSRGCVAAKGLTFSDMDGAEAMDMKISVISSTYAAGILFHHPGAAHAAVSTGAAEALELLNGYETHIPYNLTWFVLLTGSALLVFEGYKNMANW